MPRREAPARWAAPPMNAGAMGDVTCRDSRKVVEMRRVVVTGLGMVSPLACGVEPSWRRLLAGHSGARRIEGVGVSDLACKIAMPVARGGGGGSFNPDQWMEPKEQRKIDDFIVYAVAAATEALA